MSHPPAGRDAEDKPPPATAPAPYQEALARAQAAWLAGYLGEATGICNDILQRNADHPFALAVLSQIAAQQGKIDHAIRLLKKAATLAPSIASWHATLCTLYRFSYRPAQAIAAGTRAIQLEPRSADHLVSLSLAYVDMDDRQGATACLLRAIGIDANHAEAHLAMAQTLLATGDMAPGWLEYEWRNQTQAGRAQLPQIASAPWNGMAIPAGRILLIGDQGYGDTIQFARYIPLVAERCQEVILGCSLELRPLLANLPGVGRYIHRWDEVPGHAAYCRLSSLPGLFGTTLSTIPAQVPYLQPAPDRVTNWKMRLATTLPAHKPRICLAWAGRPTHPNDRRRSIDLRRLAPILTLPELNFISLQANTAAQDSNAFPGLLDVSPELADFGETAALIANLDLVVSIDTSVAHLAAAMGRPTWVLLSKAADWRWLTDRDDSPWYPSMRLFRQPSPGDWAEVISRVISAIESWRNMPRP